jgi:hypothetical protein
VHRELISTAIEANGWSTAIRGQLERSAVTDVGSYVSELYTFLESVLMQTLASTSFDAYTRLLAQPDLTDLPRRAHVWRYEGDPNRRDTRLPGIVTAWRQHRNLELDVEEPASGGRDTGEADANGMDARRPGSPGRDHGAVLVVDRARAA